MNAGEAQEEKLIINEVEPGLYSDRFSSQETV